MDWKELIRGVAPALTSILASPLAGGAVKVLADLILGGSSGDAAKDEADLATAFAGGLTPELKAKVLDGEQQVKMALIQADIRKAELATETEKSYITDVADARAHNANTVGILRLGYLINALSYLCVIMILLGVYNVLTKGQGLDKIDPNVLASISLLLGGLVQWLFSNAQQSNGFFFGSSPGSRAAITAVSNGVADTAKALGKTK